MDDGRLLRARNARRTVRCMSGTRQPSAHPRNGIYLRWDELDKILADCKGLRQRAQYLGVSVSALHRARHGGTLSAPFVHAVKTKMAGVAAYERLFLEVFDVERRAA